MYKINVQTDGKYHNVVLGERYVFSKRKTKKVIAFLLKMECNIEVMKFIKCGYCWCWSNDYKPL